MDQIRILHDLCKQEAFLHIVERSSIRSIDIRDRGEPLANSGRCIYCHEGVPRPILVHCVTFHPVSLPALTSRIAMYALPVILYA